MPSGRATSRIRYSVASALSVSPTSMCLTSLVTRASARPSSRARSSVMTKASRTPSRSPAPRRRASVAASSSPIALFGGSRKAGSGIRSILRRFRRSRTTSIVSPVRPAMRSCAREATASSSRSSSGEATRRWRSTGAPRRSNPKTSDPRLVQKKSRRACSTPTPAPNWRATFSKLVPVITAIRAPAPRSRSMSPTTRVASAVRDATAVPSQSNAISRKQRSSSGGGQAWRVRPASAVPPRRVHRPRHLCRC